MANLVEQAWICRYIRPTQIIYDCGNKLLSHTLKNDLIQNEYGINPKCATMKKIHKKTLHWENSLSHIKPRTYV